MQLASSSKWFAVTALVLITLSAMLLASTKASFEAETCSKSKTEDLISLFREAKTNVAAIFRKFETDNQTIPQESLNHYNQAVILAEESKNLLESGSYSEADNKIIQALQELKEAMRILYTTFPTSAPETDLEKTVQLKNALWRYDEQMQRIENLTSLAAAQGFDTTTFEADIVRIKSLSEEIKTNIEQKHFEAASIKIAELDVQFDRLLIAVSDLARDLTTQRLQAYINQSETRLATIREEAELQLNTASLSALNEAQTSLDNARDFLQNQQINETLSELTNSKESEEKALEYLELDTSSFENTSKNVPKSVHTP